LRHCTACSDQAGACPNLTIDWPASIRYSMPVTGKLLRTTLSRFAAQKNRKAQL
jgi:hypothetical protein